ncbi:hypothetical protein AALA82_02135 [Oscillospiraceae bacterium 50-16]
MKRKNNSPEYPVQVLREQLRSRAQQQSLLLSRSVSRLTSWDAQPCPEYGEEVEAEYETIDRLLYLQQCRAALERCLTRGRARLRYRWRDGRVSQTDFRRSAPGRVTARGLEPEQPAARAA